jgi:hypothetical protein
MRRIFALAALTAVLSQASLALAGPVGNYKEDAGGGTYSYSNATGMLTGTTTGVFSYNAVAIAAGAPALSNEPATLTITTTAEAPVVVSGSPAIGTQATSGTITITDTSGGPLNGDILLQTTFTGAVRQGQIGTTSVTLNGNEPPGTINFSTTVPGFNAALLGDPKSFTFSLTLEATTPLTVGANGNFNDFTGTDTSNFSAVITTGVPEPTTMAMALTALPILGVVRRLRRKGATA